MFRTADGTGQTGIIIAGYSPTPENPKVAKTALGADYQVPWIQNHDPLELLAQKDVIHVGLELSSRAQDIFEWQFPSTHKIFLYVGNEVTGLPAELMTKLDTLVQLPMRGEKQSLNVAEAASVALYECYRKLHSQ
jgi:tRNA G18 (ribose-2'-O)-methylase SpoU